MITLGIINCFIGTRAYFDSDSVAAYIFIFYMLLFGGVFGSAERKYQNVRKLSSIDKYADSIETWGTSEFRYRINKGGMLLIIDGKHEQDITKK